MRATATTISPARAAASLSTTGARSSSRPVRTCRGDLAHRQRPDAIAFQAANPTLAVPNPVQRWGQPDEERLRGALDMHYDLADAATIYAFGTVQQGEGVTDFKLAQPQQHGQRLQCQQRLSGVQLPQPLPAGFTPRFGTQFADLQLVSGLRGNLSDALSYDLSASAGRSRIDYTLARRSTPRSGLPARPASIWVA